MGDHWKSLANKLGAPGVDAPTPAPAAATPPSSGFSSPSKPAATRPTPSKPPEEKPIPETLIPEKVSPEKVSPERISSEKSSSENPTHERPAHDRPKHERPVEAKSAWGPAEAPRVAEAKGPATTREAPVARELAPKSATGGRSQSSAGDERAPGKPAKRKSSWDTLTSFFGISSSSAEEPPVASEPTGSAPADTDTLNVAAERLSKGTGKSQPSALDVLFGDAPRQELSWDKPKPKRIVDDVSGWDEPEAASEADDDPIARSSAETPTGVRDAEDEDADAPQRRRRRRRRGGRRDRDEEGPRGRSANSEGRSAEGRSAEGRSAEGRSAEGRSAEGRSAEGRSAEGRSAESGLESRPTAAAERDTEWGSGSSRGSRSAASHSDRRGDELEEAVGRSADEGESGEPERRSSRRRRRGRNRDVESAGREVREPRAAFDDGELAEKRPDGESDGGEVTEARVKERSERREPRREPSRREPRRRSDERPRGRGPAGETPRREPSPIDDEENQVDVSLAAELEEGGPNRHPKIPTWADTLESIIAANTENHRRLESQRGGPPRGRPRSGGSNSPSSPPGSGASGGSGGQGSGGRR